MRFWQRIFDDKEKPIVFAKFFKRQCADEQSPFQRSFGQMPIGVCRLSKGLKWMEANPQMAIMLGYGDVQSLLEGTPIFENHFADPEGLKEFKSALIKNEPPQDFQTRLRNKDGRPLPVSLSVQIERNPKGQVHFYEVYARQTRWEDIASTLTRITHAISTIQDLNHLYKAIHDILKERLDTPNFYIAIVDEIGDALFFPYYEDEKDNMWEIPGISDPQTKSLTLDVIRSGEPLFVTKEQIAEKGHSVIGPSPAVWIGIPLKVKGAVIGAMAIQHYSNPEYFTSEDFDVMTSVSEQIALAIERRMNEDCGKTRGSKYPNS